MEAQGLPAVVRWLLLAVTVLALSYVMALGEAVSIAMVGSTGMAVVLHNWDVCTGFVPT